MNNKLCFKDIPAADIDVNSLRESTLNRKASRGVKIRTVNKWYLGKPSKSGFNKYLEEIVPPDYHEDAQIFTESLDFDRRGEEPSFTFEDIKRSSRKIRESLDESNIDEYEDISQRVQDAFVSYLENNRGIIKKYFKKSKIDVNSLSSEFFNSICTDVSLEVMEDPNVLNISSKRLENYLTPLFDKTLEAYIYNESKYAKPELPKYMETSARKYKNESLGYVVEKSVLDRNVYGKLMGPFLSLMDDERNYELSKYIDDAEIFESQEDADEAAWLFCMQGLIEEFEKEKGSDIDDNDRLELENLASDIVWEDFKITPIYYSDLDDAHFEESSDSLRESRIGDVEILCQEFDEKFPEGHPKRDEYHLASLLQRFMNIDAITASNIANSWLTNGYFTH